MKLAAVQYRAPKGEPDRARVDLAAWAGRAGEAGAHLVVFPEMATTGYIWRSPDELAPHAEPARGPTASALGTVASRYAMWVVCGFPERVILPGPRGPELVLHNSALVIDPAGRLVCCYRKVLLYEADLPWAEPGAQRPVLDTELGRLAPGICMDLNDDGFVLHLHRSRAVLCAFCTNWTEEGIDAHAYWGWRLSGWRGWFVAGNTWGEDCGTAFSGESAILGPGGAVVARAPKTGDGMLFVDTEAVAGRQV